ncbi:MAG: PAS domain-containing protein [Rubellimicrobium sp.]|nr:PAS domain-containing protein [Rubellimicrobium sp.]
MEYLLPPQPGGDGAVFAAAGLAQGASGSRTEDPEGIGLLLDLERYWHVLRGRDRLPVRTDVDPARIDRALPFSFIGERLAPGVVRMRVAGQQLNSYLGMEARGMPLSVFFTPESRDILAMQVDRVFDMPAIIALPLVTPRRLLRRSLRGWLLLLPLRGSKGVVDRTLGAIALDSAAPSSAQRFDISPDRPVRCDPLAPRGERRLRLVEGGGGANRAPETTLPQASRMLRLVVRNG